MVMLGTSWGVLQMEAPSGENDILHPGIRNVDEKESPAEIFYYKFYSLNFMSQCAEWPWHDFDKVAESSPIHQASSGLFVLMYVLCFWPGLLGVCLPMGGRCGDCMYSYQCGSAPPQARCKQPLHNFLHFLKLYYENRLENCLFL